MFQNAAAKIIQSSQTKKFWQILSPGFKNFTIFEGYMSTGTYNFLLHMKERIFIIAVALSLLAGTALAQGDKEPARSRRSGSGGIPRIRTEWGIVAGVSYPWMRYDLPEGSTASLRAKMGYSAGIHIGIEFGNTFAIQPELLYTYSTIRINDPAAEFSTKVKSSTLQVPILFSFRLAFFRINVGPVLTLMDNPSYKDRNGEKVMFGRLYPTVSYAAGVGVCLLNHFLVDLRFVSRFNKTTNYLSYDAATDGTEFKTTTHSVQLKVGFLF